MMPGIFDFSFSISCFHGGEKRGLLNHLNSKHSIALTFFARNSVFSQLGYRSILKYCYFSRESGNQMQPDCSDNTFLDVCHCFYKRLVADLGLKEGGCLKGREGGQKLRTAGVCQYLTPFTDDAIVPSLPISTPSPPSSSRPSIYLSLRQKRRSWGRTGDQKLLRIN